MNEFEKYCFNSIKPKKYMTNSYIPLNEDNSSYIVSEPIQNWGGPWTEEKLAAFEKYVNA